MYEITTQRSRHCTSLFTRDYLMWNNATLVSTMTAITTQKLNIGLNFPYPSLASSSGGDLTRDLGLLKNKNTSYFSLLNTAPVKPKEDVSFTYEANINITPKRLITGISYG